MGCCEPVLAPIENYYTKYQIDKMIASAVTSGCCITPEEVDEKIEEAISGITVSGVTEEELNNAIASAKTEIEAEIPTVPTKVSAFENDVPYLTEHQSLSGYVTDAEMSAYTYDKQTIDDKIAQGGTFDPTQYYNKTQTNQLVESAVTRVEGEIPSLSGYATEQWVSSFTYDKATIDEKVAEGGTFDPTQYYNKTATNALLDEKLDVTAYTPTDLSNYYNKQEVNNIVESAKTEVEAEIPTVPTSNTAFTNDAGYLTEHQSLDNYYNKTQTDNLLDEKQNTLSAGTGIDITNNVISATGGGGGTTYTAGRGIDITNDTISLNLGVSASTGTNSIIQGSNTVATGESSHSEGSYTYAYGNYSHTEGTWSVTNGAYSHAEGSNTVTNNDYEHASGMYNASNYGSTEADNTLFSIGNGTYQTRHNAFEVRRNGDIYFNNGTSDVKLQDELSSKASTTYVQNNYLLKSKIWCGTQNEYDSIQNKDSETLYLIHE